MKEQEVDVAEMVREIWSRRKFIVKVTSVFVILGIIVALTSKVEYTATCKLLPEDKEGTSKDFGGLGGLAGLAGISLDLGGSGLNPELYPEVVKSATFLNKLINTPVYFEAKDTTISSFDYFKNLDKPSLLGILVQNTIGLPGKIKKLFVSGEKSKQSPSEIMRFTEEDWSIIESYSERLSVAVDSETGTIRIKAEMPDAIAAANVTTLLVAQLTQKISQYKTEKAQVSLSFIEERFEESRNEYEIRQNQLATFADRNRDLTTAMIRTEYDRLQNEMNIAFEVYKSLATQREQARIKVKEDTPIFTVIEEVRIPETKSKPNRRVIVFVFTFAGLAVSIGYALFIPIWKSSNSNGNK